MTAITTDWKKPGQAVQMLVANSIGQYSSRNVRGQFRHIPSAREILLAQLREEYAPVRDIQPEGLIAGSGDAVESAPRQSPETGARFLIGNARNNRWRGPSAVSAGIKPGPLPSHMSHDERVAHISVTALATMTLMLQPYWAPENLFVRTAVCIFIFGLGFASYLIAMLSR